MAGLTKRSNQLSYTWPGFVDALATLLMVIMFLLLVFVLAQFFMSQAISGRDQALTKLKTQIGELAELLSLERKENKENRAQLSQLSQELQVATRLQDNLKTTVSNLTERFRDATETIEILQAQATAMRSNNKKILANNRLLEQQNSQAFNKINQLKIINSDLQQEKIDSTKIFDKQTIKLLGLENEVVRLKALREELKSDIARIGEKLFKTQNKNLELTTAISENNKKILSLNSAIRIKDERIKSQKDTLTETKETYLKEKEISKSALAEVALLNQQMASLRKQLARIEHSLQISEADSKQKGAKIAALGKRLNIALASKVQELSKYRSEFFGRLRTLLGNRQGVRIVGDRFVFQSEVLFEKGESEIGLIGKIQLDQLAKTLAEISKEIPTEIDWVLRIDGHTDDDPIKTSRYPSNWELSTSRAISVLKYLIKGGLPANRLVAAGFGQYHPLDNRSDEIGKRRNRRIEMKLTQR